MNKYIEEADKYYRIAMAEIMEAKANTKIELAVDGCDKGWLALNLALRAMFVKKGVKPKELPKTYRGMRYFLVKYGDKELWKLYESARSILHINGFWDREVIFEQVEAVLEDIKTYIDKMKSAYAN